MMQETTIGRSTRDFNEKMAAQGVYQGAAQISAAPDSPIQSEVRSANDALDLLHMRVRELATRLQPVLVQRGELCGGATPGIPKPQKAPLAVDVEIIASRIMAASSQVDELLASLHV